MMRSYELMSMPQLNLAIRLECSGGHHQTRTGLNVQSNTDKKTQPTLDTLKNCSNCKHKQHSCQHVWSSSHSKAQGAFLLCNVKQQLCVVLRVVYPLLFFFCCCFSFAGGRWLEIRSYGDRQSISLGVYNPLCVWNCRALHPATNSRYIT